MDLLELFSTFEKGISYCQCEKFETIFFYFRPGFAALDMVGPSLMEIWSVNKNCSGAERWFPPFKQTGMGSDGKQMLKYLQPKLWYIYDLPKSALQKLSKMFSAVRCWSQGLLEQAFPEKYFLYTYIFCFSECVQCPNKAR